MLEQVFRFNVDSDLKLYSNKYYKEQEGKKIKQKKKGIYHILSNEEKKQVIESLQLDASENNFLLQSQKYNTSIRNLQRWFNQGYVRKIGCGRKSVNPQAVTDLEAWIMSETKIQQKKLTRQQIKVKALEMFNNNTFKASKMWMDNFLQKFDIKIKVLTILQNNGCLSKLQQATFNQQIRQKKEKETESQETKKNVKKQTTLVKQEQIATDLVEKQEFKGKTEVSEFLYLDENLFFDSQTKIEFWDQKYVEENIYLGYD